ncbi:annexin A4-like [Octopus vulgaris]|uniref:Annexin A4-like n=1 Tax=Octopus vulgaris TaxID=6645 RepID=A0AA36BZV1_OCTVU|nr:annexin A4-like [Octopus vulgaris]
MQGTVTAAKNFNATTAAEVLHKAIAGLGTNDAKVIELLSRYNYNQRQEMMLAYDKKYNKAMVSDVAADLSFRYKDTAVALLTEPVLYDVKELRKAMKGLGTDETTLIEIIFSRDPERMAAIKQRYSVEYEVSLEEDISGDCSGHFRHLLLSQVSGTREQTRKEDVDLGLAQQDATSLYKAGEGKLGTDEKKFNAVLAGRSFPHLFQVMKFYREKVGHDLEHAIRSETSGDLRDAYLAIAAMARGTPTLFAQHLYKYTKGLGTNDSNLIRVIVSRCETETVRCVQSPCFTLC